MPMSPHVHTVEEVKSNIKSIEHNTEGTFGPPTGGGGGSAKVRNSGNVPNVTNSSKGDDYVGPRKV